MKKIFKRTKQNENKKADFFIVIYDNEIRISAKAVQEIRLKPDDYVLLAYDGEKQTAYIEKTQDVTNGFKLEYAQDRGCYIAAEDFFNGFNIDGTPNYRINVDEFSEHGFQFEIKATSAKKTKPKKVKNKYFVTLGSNCMRSRIMISAACSRILDLPTNKPATYRLKVTYDESKNLITLKQCKKGDMNGIKAACYKGTQRIDIAFADVLQELGCLPIPGRIPCTYSKADKSISFHPFKEKS